MSAKSSNEKKKFNAVARNVNLMKDSSKVVVKYLFIQGSDSIILTNVSSEGNSNAKKRCQTPDTNFLIGFVERL